MKEITAGTRPADIEYFSDIAPYIMYRCVPKDVPAVEMTFEEMHEDQPTWNVQSMIDGACHLRDIAGSRRILWDVYTEEEAEDDPEKREVKLLYLPADFPTGKPFIVCVAGGAYTCVCSLVESIPAARHFNALGYPVFVLNYRVGNGEKPCLPKPVEDLAAAVRMILANLTAFGLTNPEYIVNGYSAGGSVVTIYGTEAKGWAHYGLPKPKALFAVYPALSTSPVFMTDPGMRAWFMGIMFGKDFDEEYAASFNVPENMTPAYPPCYIVHAADDPVVSCEQSKCLKRLLDEEGIPAELELAPFGGHGWGDGSGSGAEGWPERAAAFAEGL